MSPTVRRRRARNALLWVGISTLALTGAVILSAALLENRRGQPIIENPGALIGTIVTALSAILAIILPALLRAESNSEAARENSDAIRENVQNSHVKPMRDDMDDKHKAIMERVEGLQHAITHTINLVTGQASDIRGIRRDVGRVTDVALDTQDRVATVERQQDAALRRLDALDGIGDTEPIRRKKDSP